MLVSNVETRSKKKSEEMRGRCLNEKLDTGGLASLEVGEGELRNELGRSMLIGFSLKPRVLRSSASRLELPSWEAFASRARLTNAYPFVDGMQGNY
jgi:hypothetical protein